MNCPACKGPLIILEYDKVETDYCVNCSGVWLDSGELELLVEGKGAIAEYEEAGKSRRKCPVCRKSMQIISMGKDKTINLDRCPNGHGIWFDKGELDRVLEESAPVNEQVKQHLKEVFGRSK
jgi:Zn-finger nucleic acid-binding protein